MDNLRLTGILIASLRQFFQGIAYALSANDGYKRI